MIEQVVQLVDEELFCPEIRVAILLLQMSRVTAPHLVIQNDGNLVRLHEIRDGNEVVMCYAWSAMEKNERYVITGLEVAEDLVPGLAGFLHAWDLEHHFTFHGGGDGEYKREWVGRV